MRKNNSIVAATLIGLTFTLVACGNGETDDTSETAEKHDTHDEASDEHAGHEMDLSSSGEIPEGLEEAEDPLFSVGTTAYIEDGHMPEMNGVEVVITGAFDTTVYTVSYDPTDGGQRVEDHEWVVHEEFVEVGEEPLEIGEEASMDASHMTGMEGAVAEIDSAQSTTVYMVDFTTTDGEEVQNHKWVVEEELTAVE
ncbi:YdhK family protein [Bacillus sp. Marseille-P3800]|uniref:YdhK family protein n=1 Tax=Bacillus sp. Marseille-P3800 TaxID=2014782 RepID=UPI000C07FA5B|nr:YdhK family protein [Bacillus sp. Marseille-P3800]